MATLCILAPRARRGRLIRMGLPLAILGIGLMVQSTVPVPSVVGFVIWVIGTVLMFIGK